MVPQTREIRGSIINGYLQFIKRKWGLRGLEACKNDLDIHGKIKDGFFYPIEVKEDILKWIGDEKGEHNIVSAGKYIVSTLPWIKESSELQKMVERIVAMHNEIYNNCSARYSQVRGELRLTIDNVGGDEICRLEWLGICEGLLAASDAQGDVKIEECKDGCVFIIEYAHPF